MNSSIPHKLKRQLLGAVLSVSVSFLALTASTYAWFVSQTSVQGTTSTISAAADGAVLQINAGKVADHDGDAATVAVTDGHGITPASTKDLVNWYVPASWTANLAGVSSYQRVSLSTMGGEKDGTYVLGGKTYYAYALGTYTVFAVKNTGHADVYFDGSVEGGPIQVTRTGQTGNVTDQVAASMRVGITIDDRTNGEQLVAVYAPAEPAGAGNDENYEGSDTSNGWRCVKGGGDTSDTTMAAPYRHISGSGTWALSKVDGIYADPTDAQIKVAESVDYNGVIMRVYIWMEGTDADCLGSIVTGDESLYNVTIHLVGLTA